MQYFKDLQQVKMKPFIFLLVLGLHEVTSVTHSLKYFYTGSSGVPNVPEYVSVGMVDDVQISHCDSNTRRNVPKQDWMNNISDDPQYWEEETQNCLISQQTFKSDIEIVKQRFNHTGGAHVYQRMYGCEWDDETGEVNGYEQHGYDGEDFIAFDLKTETWTSPKLQALITKQKWDHDRAVTAYLRSYLTQLCPEWVKKYLKYGRSSLMRTVLPSVSFLQKKSSSPISCHATGFYPNRAELVWMKDGEEIHEGVEKSEILPNNDGTFQMTAEMDFSSVPADEWEKYKCVFQLSGMNEDVVTRLEKTKIRSNADNKVPGSGVPVGPVVGGIIGALLLLAGCIAGVVLWKKRYNGFTRTSTSDSSSSTSDGAEKKQVPL